MTKIKFLAIVFLITLLASPLAFTKSFAADAKAPAAAPAKDQNITMEETDWTKRCLKDEKTGKEDDSKCEIFHQIKVKGANSRVAEMAIGFPDEASKDKKNARGVVILPLGILLEDGVLMKIDDNKPALFKLRFCTNAGCVGFVNLNSDFLDTMKKGKTLSFLFKTSNGQDVNIVMNLKGFGGALKDIM